MIHRITVTEAVRSFSDIIGRVYYRGEEFDIQKGSQIVARITSSKSPSTLSIRDLNALFSSCPSLSLDDCEAFHSDLEDIRRQGGKVDNKWD